MSRTAHRLATIMIALALAGCVTPVSSWGFDAAGVKRLLQVRWNRAAHGVPEGTTVTGVENLMCQRTGRREFPRGREFRRAYWCSFTFQYRQPDGKTGSIGFDRWLVGEQERRGMMAR